MELTTKHGKKLPCNVSCPIYNTNTKMCVSARSVLSMDGNNRSPRGEGPKHEGSRPKSRANNGGRERTDVGRTSPVGRKKKRNREVRMLG